MMSRTRAQALAEALRKMYPKQRKRIDAGAVRIFCASSAEAEQDPSKAEWLEEAPLDEVAAWVDIKQLLK